MINLLVGAMEQLQLALESRAFELAYERTCRQLETVSDAERVRQIRVREILLKDDKDDLRTQLIHDDNRIDGLGLLNEQLQDDLEACAGNLQSAEGQLRIKAREVETLKAELNSLHGVTMDSTKLLTEKLSLARELSAFKTELDHLRSQAASHQSLLAEKLSLQRQLNTVQVELATEKRATQRILAKESELQAEDARAESRLEDLHAELAKERRERQKMEREAQKVTTEYENTITTLESRLNAFRNKLKSTKELLKEAQTSLQTAQATSQGKTSRPSAPANPARPLEVNSRKRAAAQIDADIIIGTPGDLPAAKKNKTGSTLIGEKSTFSITPFLNRTASVAPESPPPDEISGDDDQSAKGSDHQPGDISRRASSSHTVYDMTDTSQSLTNNLHANKPGTLQTAKTGKINSRALPRKTKATPTLEQVAEENIENENAGSAMKSSEPAAVRKLSYDTLQAGLELKRRKRKLLGGGQGKTLFDEDDGDALKGGRGLLAGVRGFGAMEHGRARVSENGPHKAIDPNASAFGAISPLKKDRKRVES